MKNSGLMKNNRQNEPNKLPIFGAHQVIYFIRFQHLKLSRHIVSYHYSFLMCELQGQKTETT